MIINLFGAPGAGKSTLAAMVFAELKINNINCELVTEYAKQLVWQERDSTLSNQIYILGKQLERIRACYDKVDVVITDSPLMLSAFYNQEYTSAFGQFIKDEIHQKFKNVNFFVNRVKPYNRVGRYQTETESNEIGYEIKSLLAAYHIPYEETASTKSDACWIADTAVSKIIEKEDF